MLRAFRDAVASVRDSVTLNELARALDVGDVDAAIRLLQLDEAAFAGMGTVIAGSYLIGGQTGAEQIGRIPTRDGRIVMRFNVRAPAAEAWIARESSRLIVEISEQQRELARAVMSQGLADGRNPRSVALDIVGRIDPRTRRRTGGFIGLTDNQAGWVRNARRELESLDAHYFTRALRDRRFDGAVGRAIRDGTPLPADTIDKAITQMQARAERYRAEVIARTESINALRAGQYQSIEQAMETEGVQDAEAERVWDASGDALTRMTHAFADGQRRPFREPFNVGGYRIMYPGDSSLGAPASETIQCRCIMHTEINFGAIAKRVEGFG